MQISISKTPMDAGTLAATEGAGEILKAIEQNGSANIILATGVSQFQMLSTLVGQSEIDWSKCKVFHLDEYIGLSSTHKASFVNYLNSRFVAHVPNLGHFEAINGNSNPAEEIKRLNESIGGLAIDVAFIGIGENGHLAFNDPPANFETNQPFIQVELDAECRNQQVSEGWFETFEEVPTHAISMSINQILNSRNIICTALDSRKMDAVMRAVEGPVTNMCPASVLQKHDSVKLFLDTAAAAGMKHNACT